MLNFLNSIFLYGLIGVSLPWIIHFLARPKFQVVHFSSISFLKRILEERGRHFRFHRSFLLFLRTMVVLFLVLGFTQPVWRGPGARAFPVSPHHSMLFLDASASMQREGVWEKAKERGKEALEQISSKSEIHFWRIGFAANERTGTKETLLHEIETCPVSTQRGDVLSFLHQGISFLQKTGTSYSELFLISDFQSTGFCSNEKALLKNSLKQWKGILYAIPVLGEKANLTIEDAGLELLPPTTGHSFRVFAKIRNWEEKEKKDILIRFFINGRAVAQKTISIKPNGVVFETIPVTVLERGYIEGKVELESDAFSIDNTRYFCGFIPQCIRILLVGHEVSDVNPYRWVLEDSQSPDSLFRLQIHTTGHSWLSLLDEVDILILSNGEELSSEQAKGIRHFLEKGKSVWFVLGNAVKLASYNEELFRPCWGDSLSLPVTRFGSTMYFTLGHVDFNDPFLQGVFRATVKKLPSPHFFRTAQFHGNSFRSILRLSNGEPLLAEFSLGEGILLVLGTGLEKDWSDLAYSNFFPPLVYRTIQYLLQFRYQRTGSGLVGEPITLSLPRSIVHPRIMVTLPSGEKEALVPEFREGRLDIRFSSTEKPGIYRFYEGEKPFAIWTVNIDPKESDFRPISRDTLSSCFPNAQMIWVDPEVSIASRRIGIPLWNFFFVMVLSLLMVESFFFRWEDKTNNTKRR